MSETVHMKKSYKLIVLWGREILGLFLESINIDTMLNYGVKYRGNGNVCSEA